MRRREFLSLLSSTVACWPLSAYAQRRFKIGLLETGGDNSFFTVPFTRKLEELGYVEGKNLVIERRPAEGNAERLKEFAADLAATAGRCHCDDRNPSRICSQAG
jgi:putative ABC transport system substrate-binding protein